MLLSPTYVDFPLYSPSIKDWGLTIIDIPPQQLERQFTGKPILLGKMGCWG